MLPRVFEAFVGGWAGPSFRVRLDGRKLAYHAITFRESEVCEENLSVEPSTEEWLAFWDALDRLGAWSWGKDYFDPDILDGTQWSVRIRLGRGRLTSQGSNAYPPTGNNDETKEFRQFRAAIGRLLGGKEFG